MNLEQQVCNLELSKRLKELGVKQESFFKWEKALHETNDKFTINLSFMGYLEGEFYSAFTASELLELLPKQWIRIEFHGKKYHCYNYFMEEERLEFGDTLADCLANMLIFIKTSGV